MGVKFGWVKSTLRSKYVPGFILTNGECKWITTQGEISSRTFNVHEYKENIPCDKNKINQMKYVSKFNKKHGTTFE